MDAETTGPAAAEDSRPPHLAPGAIFLRFLRFGLMAWGGPVTQIAMIRRELVETERWMSGARFNRLLAVFQILPGPEAHELCVYFGTLPGGRLGGLLAGFGFMLPGFILMFALSWLYFRVDLATSALGPVFLGMQPAVIALIVRAVHRIGHHVLLDRWLWALALAAMAATLAGATFWVTLSATGAIYALIRRGMNRLAAVAAVLALATVILTTPAGSFGSVATAAPPAAAASGAANPPTPVALLLSGLKAGALTFGGAYTVIPFLRDDAVGRGWMTHGQFVDGLALSGILPAPLIIFATFVGYVAGGAMGAIAMTAGIFLPAFYFALFLHDHLGRVVDDPRFHTALEGVAAGVVGLIAATTVELAVVTSGRVPSPLIGAAIFVASLALLYVWKLRTNTVFIILGAGVAGWALF